MLGIWEIIVIIIAIIVFIKWFGKSSPKVANELGKTIGEFKESALESVKEFNSGLNNTNNKNKDVVNNGNK